VDPDLPHAQHPLPSRQGASSVGGGAGGIGGSGGDGGRDRGCSGRGTGSAFQEAVATGVDTLDLATCSPSWAEVPGNRHPRHGPEYACTGGHRCAGWPWITSLHACCWRSLPASTSRFSPSGMMAGATPPLGYCGMKRFPFQHPRISSGILGNALPGGGDE